MIEFLPTYFAIEACMYDCSYTEMEIDDFVEASSELIEPLEDFFNKVFVMVVGSSDFFLLLRFEKLK